MLRKLYSLTIHPAFKVELIGAEVLHLNPEIEKASQSNTPKRCTSLDLFAQMAGISYTNTWKEDRITVGSPLALPESEFLVLPVFASESQIFHCSYISASVMAGTTFYSFSQGLFSAF